MTSNGDFYKQEKCLNKLAKMILAFCVGYGYRPMRIVWAFIVLAFCGCAMFFTEYCVVHACFPIEQFFGSLPVSIAAIADQSSLELKVCEHHPCFELFYRNTGGFLYGKPCVTRLSTFLAYVPIYHETPKLRRCFYTPASRYEHDFSIYLQKRKWAV